MSRLGSPDVWYKYDALGRRIERNKGVASPVPVALETTRFVYDAADVVRDLDGSGATIADYLNGPGIDNKLRQTTGSTVAYFAADHLRSTRALTDASGSSTASLSYDSFGNVVSGSASTRYTYTGRESDSDTGLMYYRARSYDRVAGRFISEDPIELKGGVNFYAYTGNNPINYTDPSGLELDSMYRAMRPLRRGDQPGAENAIQPAPSDNVSIFRLLWDFFTSVGPRERSFGPDADMTSGLRTSPDVWWHKAWWCSEGKGSYKNQVHEQFGFGARDGPWRAGFNGPRQFVGTFNLTIIELRMTALSLSRGTQLPCPLFYTTFVVSRS